MKKLHPLLQESLEIPSMKLGLERMEAIDRLLGFPSKQFPSVLVAGTNGKGSVATKIAKSLAMNGKKVGLYTSPHIHSYHERMRINGLPISEQRADLLLKKIISMSEVQPSYFELLTALCFCYFAEERVDFAVLEVGMGGRQDATNIVTPVLSIITSISFDHCQYLGTTLEAIAFEKAGIIKPGVPTLLGPHAQPLHVFESVAEKTTSPLFQIVGTFSHYEEENQAIARRALTLLPFPLENKSIEMGLAAVAPCRFEIVSTTPLVILDVAHNPDGLEKTLERILLTFPGKKIRVLAGFSQDKSIEECVDVINKYAVELHLSHVDHVRLAKLGAPLDQIFEKVVLQANKNNEILLICGTFFIMHQALLLLEKRAALAKSEKERGDD